ncbi:MAG: hypothetical protein KC426_04225 [Oceanospirillaceae bacterium]|nr:hypothetical protein [Oceanospirillaceae bacterium]
MLNFKQTFNIFVAVHFFLNGLLPLYVPVYLIQRGYDLEWVTAFVAVSTVGFLAGLYVWKKWYFNYGLKPIIVASFVAQLCLITSLALFDHVFWLVVSALLYGVVNCFLWTSQRVLFLALMDSLKQASATGRLLGNFQILAVVAIKLGLLVGAFLLAQNSFFTLVALATIVAIGGTAVLVKGAPSSTLWSKKLSIKTNELGLTWRQMLVYRDGYYSSLTFYIDGAFLFAESFFWVISLYFLSQQNIQYLSFLLVALSIILGLVFWLLKNRIDQYDPQKVYWVAVIGYVISWGLRAQTNLEMPHLTMNLFILVIAFLTAFFRLSFNKRLFDNAQRQSPLLYILAKTYGSQMGAMIFFAGVTLGVYLYGGQLSIDSMHLNSLYWPVAGFSGLYILYQLKPKLQSMT